MTSKISDATKRTMVGGVPFASVYHGMNGNRFRQLQNMYYDAEHAALFDPRYEDDLRRIEDVADEIFRSMCERAARKAEHNTLKNKAKQITIKTTKKGK